MNPNPVYAEHASEIFNDYLDSILQDITADVLSACGDNLISLILGGGYGRGEGGVISVEGAERPYNDLDFSIIVRSISRYPHEKIREISHKHEKRIKIDVDFSRPLTLKAVKQWPHWLMWYDLYYGHIVLFGPDSILKDHAPDYIGQQLPATEALRLMLNRGAGLLWSKLVIRGIQPAPDPDFIRRNYYKCLLAMGDALLITTNSYTTRYSGRDVLLCNNEQLTMEPFFEQVIKAYKSALEFKFRPDSLAKNEIDEQKLKESAKLWSQVFLYIENCRLKRNWTSMDSYIQWKGIRENQENRLNKLHRNLLQNLKSGVVSTKYRREYLYRRLPPLLGLTDCPVVNWIEESKDFLEIWNRYN